MRTPTVNTRLAGVGLALVLALTGCGDSSDPDSPTASDRQTAANGDVYNGADVDFAQSMIQHHAQAIQMVLLTRNRPLDAEVETLANAVRDAQVPEIETMSDWLTAWGEKVPETSLSHSNAGHDMEDMDGMEGMDEMPGMMSEEDMTALEDAPDDEFQSLWLDMMIQHHQGAVEMAQTETEDGLFEPATSIAEGIASSQQDEISVMEDLRG